MRLTYWLIAPAVVLVGFLLSSYFRAEVPQRADWRDAVAHVRTNLAPGDGVTWAPYWAGEGRLFFHGLPAFHVPRPIDADFSRYDRVWLLGAFGRGAADFDLSASVVQTTHFGSVTLELLEISGEKVVADLRRDLDSVRVLLGDAPGKLCDFWDGHGWHCQRRHSEEKTMQCLAESTARRLRRHLSRRDPHCGLDPWLHVSRDVRVIGDGARRCVWFHPRAGQPTRIVWPIKADFDELVVDYGFTDRVISNHTRPSPRTQPAELTVSWRASQVAQERIEPVKGWRRARFNVDGKAGGEATLQVTTQSTVDAQLCIDVTARRSAE